MSDVGPSNRSDLTVRFIGQKVEDKSKEYVQFLDWCPQDYKSSGVEKPYFFIQTEKLLSLRYESSGFTY